RRCSARPARRRSARSATSPIATALSRARKTPWKRRPDSLLKGPSPPNRRLQVDASAPDDRPPRRARAFPTKGLTPKCFRAEDGEHLALRHFHRPRGPILLKLGRPLARSARGKSFSKRSKNNER